jgi:hypothetical protein
MLESRANVYLRCREEINEEVVVVVEEVATVVVVSRRSLFCIRKKQCYGKVFSLSANYTSLTNV